MTLRLFQVDAFARERFAGNAAAVIPLEEWLGDALLQSISAENNLSETAFLVSDGGNYQLRWFTPTVEVELCGHATLASAFVIFEQLEPGRSEVSFETRSGTLNVSRAGDRLIMDFPVWGLKPVNDPPADLLAGLGIEPAETFAATTDDNFFAVLADEAAVRAVQPNFDVLARLHPAGVVITAPGNSSDCVSRYFVPGAGIPEDPATGSIHCGLVPYWAERLGKPAIHARQASRRGAELFCELRGDRVEIAGYVVPYLEGVITL
ncbi:MAG: PhzF family phenazine biosynthesis protein [Candidatus Rariloculaceae bacterium]